MPVTKKANIGLAEAKRAVAAYFRGKPYTTAGLKRVPCAQCGAPSVHQWVLEPCAIGKKGWYGLCREHDIELNRIVVGYLKVSDGDVLMAEYEARA